MLAEQYLAMMDQPGHKVRELRGALRNAGGNQYTELLQKLEARVAEVRKVMLGQMAARA